MATKISQREAVRNRRELKRLREFVWQIRYAPGQHSALQIGRVPLCDLSKGRIQGVRAVEPRATLVCSIDGNEIVCHAVVPPEVA